MSKQSVMLIQEDNNEESERPETAKTKRANLPSKFSEYYKKKEEIR